MLIILDAGHGVQTPGKRSPDGQLKEYKYAREIANLVYYRLKGLGYEVVYLMEDELNDVPLNKRVSRINEYCSRYGKSLCLVVSIHVDAAGADGQWHNATGWSARVSLNASTKSKLLAGYLFDAALKEKIKTRLYLPSQKYWELNLAICRDTKCPAVLTENLFMDNKNDVEFLLSEEGKNKIVNLHLNGIILYVKENAW